MDIDEIIDYRNETFRWGWRLDVWGKSGGASVGDVTEFLGLGRSHITDKSIVMTGCESLGCIIWAVKEIEYSNNPTDMYHAKLELLGIINLTDKAYEILLAETNTEVNSDE